MPDAIVVGGGLAGLVTANRAAELGCSVLVLEQGADPAYLCNSRIATGSVNFAHANPELPPDELVAAINADTENHADPALSAALAAVAGRGLRWLMDNGATFIRRELQDKQTWLLAPPRSFRAGLDWRDRGADRLLGELTERLKQRGGSVTRGARARSLIARDGRMLGVAVDVAGQVTDMRAAAVVLADGGFQGDPDLVRKYIAPNAHALVQRSAGTGRGDGIRMADAVGAKLVEMHSFYGHLLSRDAMTNPGLWPYPTLDSMTGGSILIDQRARRCFDEGLGGILLSNLIAKSENPLGMTIIFDEEIWTTTGLDEVVPANPFLVEAGGTLVQAATLAELAARIGVPADNLAETVAGYNRAIMAGQPDSLDPPRTPGRRFGVRRNSPDRIAPRPVQRPPFYAAPLSVGISCTTGGVAIDTAARVLRAGGGWIEGLYAAGSITGGIEGGPIAGYIGGLAKAYCTGLIAAESIAARRA